MRNNFTAPYYYQSVKSNLTIMTKKKWQYFYVIVSIHLSKMRYLNSGDAENAISLL